MFKFKTKKKRGTALKMEFGILVVKNIHTFNDSLSVN